MSARPLLAQEVQRSAATRREIRGTVIDSASRQPIVGRRGHRSRHEARSDQRFKRPLSSRRLATAAVYVAFRRIGFNPVTRHVDLSGGSAVVDAVSRIAPGGHCRLQRQSRFGGGVSPFREGHRDDDARRTFSSIAGRRSARRSRNFPASRSSSTARASRSRSCADSFAAHRDRSMPVCRRKASSGAASMRRKSTRSPRTRSRSSADRARSSTGRARWAAWCASCRGRCPRRLFNGELPTNAFSNNRQGAGSLMLEGADLPMPWLGSLGWRAAAERASRGRREDARLLPAEHRVSRRSTTTRRDRDSRDRGAASQLSYSHFGTNLGDVHRRARRQPRRSQSRHGARRSPRQSFAADIARPIRRSPTTWSRGTPTVDAARSRASRDLIRISAQRSQRIRQPRVRRRRAPGVRARSCTRTRSTCSCITRRGGAFTGTVGVSRHATGQSVARTFVPDSAVSAVHRRRFRTRATDALSVDAQRRRSLSTTAGSTPISTARPSSSAPKIGATTSDRPALWVRRTSSPSRGRSPARRRRPGARRTSTSGSARACITARRNMRSVIVRSCPSGRSTRIVTLRHLGARSRLEVSAYRNQIDGYIFLQPRDPDQHGARRVSRRTTTRRPNALLLGTEVTGQVDPDVVAVALRERQRRARHRPRRPETRCSTCRPTALTTSARFTGRNSARVVNPFFEIGNDARSATGSRAAGHRVQASDGWLRPRSISRSARRQSPLVARAWSRASPCATRSTHGIATISAATACSSTSRGVMSCFG